MSNSDLKDSSLSGSSVHGIIQESIMEWNAISSSGGSSQPRVQIHISCGYCIGRQVLYHWVIWEALTLALTLVTKICDLIY